MDIGIIGGADGPTSVIVTSSFYGWLHLGSLFLGLIAWILPIINLARRNKAACKNWMIFSFLSVVACAVSLYMQIFCQHHLVNIEAWPALTDTSNTAVLVSSVLLVVTVALNIITAAVYRRNH